MFLVIGQLRLYLEPTGLAAAKIEVLALSVVMIPALAIDTVCCSITSWRTLRVASDILSNSSIQHTPPSLNTSAPLHRYIHQLAVQELSYYNSPLQNKLLAVGVACDIGGKTNSRRAFSGCIDTTWSDLVHVLKDLRLRSTGITD